VFSKVHHWACGFFAACDFLRIAVDLDTASARKGRSLQVRVPRTQQTIHTVQLLQHEHEGMPLALSSSNVWVPMYGYHSKNDFCIGAASVLLTGLFLKFNLFLFASGVAEALQAPAPAAAHLVSTRQ
jgi:hypothetical protein